ncbi:MAG: hypothetical protein QOH04_289 [Sphingomonadales bacterium]|jgi:uncharacterized membrane protein YdbT with pleckstrin-like domain|nr:hypothetical protein [Sphingomonadales bacterium]
MDQPLDSFRSSTWGWLRGTIAGWGTLLLCLVGVGLIIVLVQWLRFVAATFEVTNDRLIIRHGIFSKSIDEIELYRVKDVRLDYSLVNQWAGIGTITILSSDETTRGAPLVVPFVEQAEARREQLRDLVDQVRRRRGVREIDMVPEAV